MEHEHAREESKLDESDEAKIVKLIKSPFIELLILLKCKDIYDKDKDLLPLINNIVKYHNPQPGSDTKQNIQDLIPQLMKKCNGKDILGLIATMLDVIDSRL